MYVCMYVHLCMYIMYVCLFVCSVTEDDLYQLLRFELKKVGLLFGGANNYVKEIVFSHC